MDAAHVASLAGCLFHTQSHPPRITTELEEHTVRIITQLSAITHMATPLKNPKRGKRFLGWDHSTETTTKELRRL